MPIVFGFSNHRKNCLERELSNFTKESPQLGAKSIAVFGDFPLGKITPETPLDLLIIQQTNEDFHNRDEFWITHLRPTVHTRFFVYTPNEFSSISQNNYTFNVIKKSMEIIFQDKDKVLK